jgi:hypothetical protein
MIHPRRSNGTPSTIGVMRDEVHQFTKLVTRVPYSLDHHGIRPWVKLLAAWRMLRRTTTAVRPVRPLRSNHADAVIEYPRRMTFDMMFLPSRTLGETVSLQRPAASSARRHTAIVVVSESQGGRDLLGRCTGQQQKTYAARYGNHHVVLSPRRCNQLQPFCIS